MEGGSESQKEIGRESQRERERERERSERRKKRGQTVEIPTLKCRNCERQISVYEVCFFCFYFYFCFVLFFVLFCVYFGLVILLLNITFVFINPLKKKID